jgi:diguanylate cyclase (GGDEF)-like protein
VTRTAGIAGARMTWCHTTGDSVLKRIANTIQSSLIATESVGRIGGEKFLLISIQTDI